MKKTLATITLLAGAVGLYGQGNISWQDAGATFSISVFAQDPTSPTVVEQYGNTSVDTPAGTAGASAEGLTGSPNYGGIYLAGSGYTIGIYIDTTQAALAADLASGAPVQTSTFQTGANAGLWATSGLIAVDSTIPGGSSGTPVWIQLAAWANTGSAGAANSYGQAVADGYAAGYSVVSTTAIPLGAPPGTPPSLGGLGITDFSLASPIPEPSTIALGVIGASAFLMRLRRNK